MADQGVLLQLEHDWASAFRDTDHRFLESLLASEFRLSFVDDVRAPKTLSRADWFANLDRMTFGDYEIYHSKEVIFGKVGFLHMDVRFDDWTFDGNPLPSDYTVNDIYDYRENRWQVTNRISEPKGESPKFG